MARASTGELEVGASLLSARVSLVAAVPAIVLPVALPGHRDAPAVVAPELGILAGHINAPSLVWGNTNESNSSGYTTQPGLQTRCRQLIIDMRSSGWSWL